MIHYDAMTITAVDTILARMSCDTTFIKEMTKLYAHFYVPE